MVGALLNRAISPATSPTPAEASPARQVRIVYVMDHLLTAWKRERYGMNFFLRRGAAVTVIDVGAVAQPSIQVDRGHYAAFADLDVRIVSNGSDLAVLSAELRAASVIFALMGTAGITVDNLDVFRLISRSGRPYGMLMSNAFPGWNKYRGERGMLLSRIRHVLRRLHEIHWANSIVARVPPRWLGIRPADFVVRGGTKSALPNRLVSATTRAIAVHSMDYELSRNVRTAGPERANTAVFIDEYLPYHPDIEQLRTKSPMNAEAYFASLRGLFDRIERELGLEVVIAACPVADYSDKPDVFGRRQVIFDRTAELIARSRLVLAHRSTAIGYAIINRKPLMIIATRAVYEHTAHKPVFDAITRELNKKVAFIDSPETVDLSNAFAIDTQTYDRYLAEYIKPPGTADAPYWDIVVDAMRRFEIASV